MKKSLPRYKRIRKGKPAARKSGKDRIQSRNEDIEPQAYLSDEDCFELDDDTVSPSDQVTSNSNFHGQSQNTLYSEAYYRALKHGEVKNTRIPIMIVGNDRTGKTSLRKHLLGMPFDTKEPSTNGIEVDVVELTTENARDAWRKKERKFFTSAKEAEKKIFINAAKVMFQEKQDNDQSNDQDDILSIAAAAPLSDDKVVEINEILCEEFDSEQPVPVRVFIHDFAGQSIYYDTHFCFLKMLCPYLLVVDASVNLEEPAQPRFKFKSIDVERKLNDPFLETNLDCLLSWLTVLEKLSDFYSEICESGDLKFKLPPIVIILTNIDRCKDDINKVEKRIKELRTHKAFQNVLSDIFLIDNTSLERNGSKIKKLRSLLYKLCTSILNEQPLMPVRWLQFEGVLSDMMLNKKVNHISVENAHAIAKTCNIDDPDAAMRFLHHQGIIVYHSESPIVVLNPPWLMNLFTEIITVPQEEIPREAPSYKLMMSKGILMQDYLQRQVREKLLEDLMKQFSLICQWEYEGECAYIVPSVAPLMDEGQDIQERLSTSPIIPVFIQFNWSYVPLGYFTRFQTNMIDHCRKDLLTIPQIYCNYTLLSFSCIEGEFDVYLIKIPGKIKVGVVPQLGTDAQAYSAFIRFLKQYLQDCMKKVKDEEPLIYRNVDASLVVKCPVCCGKTEDCRLQHSRKVECGRDECCHFWQLNDLQNLDTDPVCRYNHQTTSKFPLNRLKFWLAKEKDSERQAVSEYESSKQEENAVVLPSGQVPNTSGANGDFHGEKSLENGSWKWIETSKVHREMFKELLKYGCDHPEEIKDVNGVRVCCSKEFLIGRGADGTRVYIGLGKDGCEKAVKRLHRDVCTGLAEQEKEILVKIKSNNVVKYWFLSDEHYDKEYLFLILDLCEETLEDFVNQQNSTDNLAKIAPVIIRQVLEGLHDLHHGEPPILHRDLKPKNILRNVDGKWLLADFGISRFLAGGVTTHLSVQRGTKDWRAVESYPSSDDVSNDGQVRYKKESDIQVAGMVAFYILTKGEHPFGKEGYRLPNLQEGTPVGLEKLDFAANDLISWMLKRDPKDRPSAKEALKHPYLQSKKRQFEMLCKIGNQPEIKKGDNSSNVVKELNKDPKDWKTFMETDVLNYLCADVVNRKSKTFHYRSSWTECLRLIRNVNQHWNDRPRPLPQPAAYYIVSDPKEYFLKIFPNLPVVVHRIVRQCDWKDRSDLRKYFI